MTGIVIFVLVRLEWATLFYSLLVNSFYALLLASAVWELSQHLLMAWRATLWRVLGSDIAPTISVLAPAYNEGAGIGESVRSLLVLYYPRLEIVVVNDGSGDDTMAVLADQFELERIHPIYQKQIETKPVVAMYRSLSHPNLVVVDKENGGKADALNAGLCLATGELVCSIDADTLIESDALQRMVRPFLGVDDVLAAGGTIRVVNGCTVKGGRVVSSRAPRGAVASFQVVEYLRAFLFGRVGWNRLGGNLIISGAFGLFRREAMIAGGGYAADSVGEDMELIMRLRRGGYERKERHRVEFIPDPVAWTEVPESLSVLGGQRDRWHRGLADVLLRHRRVLLNPRYGALGLVVFPYFLFAELLAPVVEAVGIIGLIVSLGVGAVDAPFAGLFFLASYGYGLVLTVLTLVMEELTYHRYEGRGDVLWLVMWALVESFGYRQLTVWWWLRGLGKFLLGRTDWGNMQRRGFHSSEVSP